MSNEEIIKPNQLLGEAIVHEAQEDFDAKKKKIVIGKVSNYIEVISKCKFAIQQWSKVKNHNQMKIDALKKGDFDFDNELGTISFHNEELNIEWERP